MADINFTFSNGTLGEARAEQATRNQIKAFLD